MTSKLYTIKQAVDCFALLRQVYLLALILLCIPKAWAANLIESGNKLQ